MRKPRRLLSAALLLLLLLPPRTGAAGAEPQLRLPDFAGLADSASESVNITLDSALLGLAARFLDPAKTEDAAARDLIQGLRGIYIRSFTFDRDYAYPAADVDALRRQLAPPLWQRLVEVRSRKERAHVDVYLAVDQGKANGLAIIASEPREFTIVNIVGSIDLDKLHRLEGKLGVPKLQLEDSRKATRLPP